MRVLASLSVVIVAFLWTSQCDFTAAVPQQRDESSNGYMNEWAVEVAAGPQAADRVAATHGLKNVGKVIILIPYILCRLRFIDRGEFLCSR